MHKKINLPLVRAKDLYSTYSRMRGNQATPRQMLKIVLYSYMNHNYSSRSMELSCKRDVNFMYLLEGSQVPDHSTFARFRSIHFIKSMENFLYFKYFKIVADAGYESEENYVYIQGNGQLSYIKPANYEISKTRKYINDISRIENMDYTELGDYYTCKNNKKLMVHNIVKRKSKTGYISEKTVYSSEDCSNCQHKIKCIKGHNCKAPLEERVKNLETSKLFNMLRKENLERIVSKEGCLLRMNRSIQAEGSFAEIKQDMGFRRYLSKGKKNVLAESVLLSMAHNINKLHNKIQFP